MKRFEIKFIALESGLNNAGNYEYLCYVKAFTKEKAEIAFLKNRESFGKILHIEEIEKGNFFYDLTVN